MDFYLQYKEQLDMLLKDEDNVNFFCELAHKSFRQDTEFYRYVLESTLSFTKLNNLHKATAWLNNYYCWYYFDMSKYKEAIEVALDAYNVLEKYGNKNGMARLCNSLMSCYSQIGQIELSNEWGIKGVEMAEEIHDDELLLVLMLNIGIGYIQLENFKKAKEIFNYIKAMDYKLEGERKITFAQCIAEIEINIGDVDKAIKEIHKVYELFRNINYEFFISETKKLEAMAYCKLNDYEKADMLFKESYDFAVKFNQNFELCHTLVKWSDMYIKINQVEKGIEKLEEFIPIGKEYDFYQLLRFSYFKLYNIYKRREDLGKALFYLEEYTSVDEKIYNFQSSQWMAKLDASHSEREANLYKILYDKTELLSSIGKEIISTLDENNILKVISKEIHKLMKTDMFSIAVYNEETNEITYKYIDDSGKINLKGPVKINQGNHLTGYCITHKEDILIQNFNNEFKKYVKIDSIEEYSDQEADFSSLMYTPMIVKGKIIGIMTVQSKDENVYTQNDMSTLKVLSNYVSIALDNAISYKKMESIAIYDNLTGLLSRREILKIGNAALKHFNSNKEKLTIAMIDIDKFKDVNDTYGHVTGDRVLREIAESITKNIRRADFAGRYGGDEFLLVFPNTKIDRAKTIAERVRKLVYGKKHLVDKNKKINVSISIGLYEIEEGVDDFMSGIKRADIALYGAKNKSRNCVVIYNEM